MLYCMAVCDDRAPGCFCNDYIDAMGTVGEEYCLHRRFVQGDIKFAPEVDVTSKNVVKKVANNPHQEGTAGRGGELFTTFF